jgi:hypothetical protein
MEKEIRKYLKKYNIIGITDQPKVISILIRWDKDQAMFNISKDEDIKKQCKFIEMIINDEVEFKER